MAQLKALFKDSYESIVGNCDTFLYLGGNEQSTHEYISKMLGKRPSIQGHVVSQRDSMVQAVQIIRTPDESYSRLMKYVCLITQTLLSLYEGNVL